METQLEELDGNKRINNGVRVNNEGNKEWCKCLELQDNVIKASEECACMELKLLKLEDEIRMLKQKNEDLEQSIRNDEEDDKITQLMIENKVLECEKNKAERDSDVWKVKCKELEMQVFELQRRLLTGMTKTGVDSAKMNEVGRSMHGYEGAADQSFVQTENKANEKENAEGTPPIETTGVVERGRRCELKSSVRKCLNFRDEGSSCKNIYPTTPGGRPPSGPIDISDSDDDLNVVHLHDIDSKGRKEVQSTNDVGLGVTGAGKELTADDKRAAVLEQKSDEEDIPCYNEKRGRPYLSTSKKRRVSKIITSESDSDIDDNIPIGELVSKNLLRRNLDPELNSSFLNDSSSRENFKVVTPRRRLVRLGNSEERGVSRNSSYKTAGSKRGCEIVKAGKESSDDDEIEEDGSEGESLGGFIVSSSEVSATASSCDEISEHNDTVSGDDSDKASDDNMAYDEIISSLRRDRKDKMKWEYEADMLADFGKSPNLCMKAVCAIYRQQTSEERSCKATILLNGRGFSQIHASMGSALAEFLTDGDSEGDVRKTVEELQEFNWKGVEICRNLATNYSKQLFEIYKNKEDPFFQPQ